VTSTFGTDPHNLERTIEAAPIAIVIADDRGRIVLVNPETERLFKYGTELASNFLLGDAAMFFAGVVPGIAMTGYSVRAALGS
jgi:hypothetical protein